MAIKPVKQIVGIHKNDVEWIIALWFAIHGGDPVPERVGAAVGDIIKNLAAHLPAEKARAVAAALH